MRDALGAVQSVLVLGGGSDIALATVRQLVRERTRTVVLAAREAERLQPVAEELRALGTTRVELVDFDADALDTHPSLLDDVFARVGDIDLVLVAFGVLGDAAVVNASRDRALDLFRTNVMGSVSTILAVAERLRRQGHGELVVLSSVAGERVRRSNFVYGASKAAVDGLCQGLGDALAGSGVHLMIVRPGFVRTKMTEGMDDAPLSTDADAVAATIVAGIRRRRDVVWSPPPLRWVMALLRHVPRPVFRRLPL